MYMTAAAAAVALSNLLVIGDFTYLRALARIRTK